VALPKLSDDVSAAREHTGTVALGGEKGHGLGDGPWCGIIEVIQAQAPVGTKEAVRGYRQFGTSRLAGGLGPRTSDRPRSVYPTSQTRHGGHNQDNGRRVQGPATRRRAIERNVLDYSTFPVESPHPQS